MDEQRVTQVVDLLRVAAERERLVPYKRFHSLFNAALPLRARYDVLEQAVRCLAEPRCVDFGVLLASENGLPGDEFYVRFKATRRSEYDRVMGVGTCGRSATRRRTLAESERARVFAYVQQVCALGTRRQAL